MRELRVVYNPIARRGRFISQVDRLTEIAQSHGFLVSLYRMTGKAVDAKEMLSGLGDSAIIVACGGDGTLQEVVNALVDYDLNIPVGLLPYGTSNDFADSLGLTTNPSELVEYIETGNIGPVDLGCIGDKCFVNVFSAGQITKVSHGVDRVFKDHMGMLAYYLHSMEHLPKMTAFDLTLKGDIQESFKCLLFLALNSTSAGGFKNLAPKANLNDGALDIIAVRECSLPEIASVLIGVLRGEHHNHPAVLYARAAHLEVSGPADVATDIDGERGPALPVRIEVLPGRIQMLGAPPLPQNE